MARMMTHQLMFMAVFCMFIGAQSAWSGELILQAEQLKVLSEKARNQPYRTKGGILSRELMSYELGVPVTPYFFDAECRVSKRRYRAEKRCLEVSFLSGLNQVKRIPCGDPMADLRLPGLPGFKPSKVSELSPAPMNGFSFFDHQRSFVLSGFVHDQETVRMDQAVLGLPDRSSFPRQSFSVDAVSRGAVSLDSKNGLKIAQELRVKVGKLGFLDARERNVRSSVVRGPNDLVFSDGSGKVVVMNDLLIPGALRGFLMEIDSRFASALEGLESQSRVEPVCYRDSSWGPGEQGCHRMIEAIPVVRWSAFKLLLVDFNSKQVSVLD
jgi:hypothetical protein